MTDNKTVSGGGSLAFFGNITAAATHDLKNNLAILNENAGLLADLAVMAQTRGSGVEPERAIRISEKIQKQVARADRVLKRLNRFSHSMDTPFDRVDVPETVLLVANLARRRLQAFGASLEVVLPREPFIKETHAFLLMHLVFSALLWTGKLMGSDKRIRISFKKGTVSPSVEFHLKSPDKDALDSLTPSSEEKQVLEYLNIHLIKNHEAGRFSLSWPDDANQ